MPSALAATTLPFFLFFFFLFFFFFFFMPFVAGISSWVCQ